MALHESHHPLSLRGLRTESAVPGVVRRGSGENGHGHHEKPKTGAAYLYLNRVFEMTPEMQAATQATYDSQSADYAARVEWTNEKIESVGVNVLRPMMPYIRSLGEQDVALLLGAGTLRDAQSLHEKNPAMKIVALDASENQLREGLLRLEKNGVTEHMGGALLAMVAKLPDLDMFVHQRFKLAMMVTVLQHLSETDTLDSIGHVTRILQPGSMFQCDVRIDLAAQNHIPDEILSNLNVYDLNPGGVLFRHGNPRGSAKPSRGRIFADTILDTRSAGYQPSADNLDARNVQGVKDWLVKNHQGSDADTLRFYQTYSFHQAYNLIVEACEKYNLQIEYLNLALAGMKPPILNMIFSTAEES